MDSGCLRISCCFFPRSKNGSLLHVVLQKQQRHVLIHSQVKCVCRCHQKSERIVFGDYRDGTVPLRYELGLFEAWSIPQTKAFLLFHLFVLVSSKLDNLYYACYSV